MLKTKYHVVRAKRIVKRTGWRSDRGAYAYFFFPADDYSKEDAISLFRLLQMDAWDEPDWHCAPLYEYNGEIFFSADYCGTTDAWENELV